jgi:hypothetical protein
VLRQEMEVAALAGEDPLDMGRHHLQQLRRHQPVVNDHVAGLQDTQRLQRQELGVARSCPHQVDLADRLAHVRFDPAFAGREGRLGTAARGLHDGGLPTTATRVPASDAGSCRS